MYFWKPSGVLLVIIALGVSLIFLLTGREKPLPMLRHEATVHDLSALTTQDRLDIPLSRELCRITPDGEVLRGETFRESSCADYRKATAQYAVAWPMQYVANVWFCWLLDPCAQQGH